MRLSLLRACGLFALICASAAGCNASKKVKITGRFLKDGQPYSYPEKTLVTLNFRPAEAGNGTPVLATVKKDLSGYDIELPAGKYKVSFTAFPADFQPGSGASNYKPGAGMPPPPTGPPPPGAGGKDADEVYDLTSSKTLDLPAPALYGPKK